MIFPISLIPRPIPNIERLRWEWAWGQSYASFPHILPIFCSFLGYSALPDLWPAVLVLWGGVRGWGHLPELSVGGVWLRHRRGKERDKSCKETTDLLQTGANDWRHDNTLCQWYQPEGGGAETKATGTGKHRVPAWSEHHKRGWHETETREKLQGTQAALWGLHTRRSVRWMVATILYMLFVVEDKLFELSWAQETLETGQVLILRFVGLHTCRYILMW